MRKLTVTFQFRIGKSTKPEGVKTIFTPTIWIFVLQNRIRNLHKFTSKNYLKVEIQNY